MFQTREISYDYKICVEWGKEQQRVRRLRRVLAMAAPVAVALLAGMASSQLSNRQFHLPPWQGLFDKPKPSAEKVLRIPVAFESSVAYQTVVAELEPVSNPFTPHHIFEPAPTFGEASTEPTLQETADAGPLLSAVDEGSATPDEDVDSEWQTVTVNAGDSLSVIFERLGLSHAELDRILGLGGNTSVLKTLRPQDNLRFRISDGNLEEIVHQIDVAHTLHVRYRDGSLSAETVRENLDTRTATASGVIHSSLFEAGQAAGLSDTAIMNMAEIFDFDIDLVLDIQDGDRFSVVYEEVCKNGKKLKDGNILAAEFINRGKSYRAVRYERKDGSADYYRPDGRSLRRAFIRTPVAFSRISSKFSSARRHPVLNRIRAHKGVDYAAPMGTPIKATGDGTIAFAGWQGGYGRVVQLEHAGGYTTVYGHMSRFASAAKVGQHVKLGQTIGYVGRTGLATGPHLHYEFRVNGVHRDPLTVKLPNSVAVAREHLPDFEAKTRESVAMLDQASRLASREASGETQTTAAASASTVVATAGSP